jgi:superoxide reductase
MEECTMGFAERIHAPEFEGKEKHVPDIAASRGETGTVITVKVGKEVLHPTTKEHHIAWVKLFGETADGKSVEIGMLDFGEGTALPVGSIMVETSAYTAVTALAYCNLHGVWDNSLTL